MGEDDGFHICKWSNCQYSSVKHIICQSSSNYYPCHHPSLAQLHYVTMKLDPHLVGPMLLCSIFPILLLHFQSPGQVQRDYSSCCISFTILFHLRVPPSQRQELGQVCSPPLISFQLYKNQTNAVTSHRMGLFRQCTGVKVSPGICQAKKNVVGTELCASRD